MQKAGVCDTVTSEPCPNCGSKGWIIDSASIRAQKRKEVWLLCLGLNCSCVETKPLDETIEFIPEE